MSDDHKRYPTWGDLAREQLQRRGLPYFADVQQAIQNRLGKISPVARAAFALCCSERLMQAYERLPAISQSSFTLSWRPVLDVMWVGLSAAHSFAPQRVQAALDAFHASPYDHNDGPDGPQDADEHAAAASIYTAECYLSGDVQAAWWAASRAIDAAFRIAEDDLQLDPNDFVCDPNAEPMPLAQEAMHPAVQRELQRQLTDLALLEQHDVVPYVLEQLKRSEPVQARQQSRRTRACS